METLNKLKVADLKKLLKQKNLSTDGNKSTLINRILGSGDQGPADKEISTENLEADEDLLLGNDDTLEPVETKNSARSPTTKVPRSSTTTTNLESSSMPVKAPSNTSKVLSPSVPEKSAANANGKMGDRIKRFGVVSEEEKKKSRTERFQATSSDSNQVSVGNGTSKTTASQIPKVTDEQLKKRAERFGLDKSSSSKQTSGGDMLKKRAERFGSSTSVTPVPNKDVSNDVMLKRKARFEASTDGSSSEAKKQRRAERFGPSSS